MPELAYLRTRYPQKERKSDAGSTFSSLLLVRKSVEGLRMAVIALTSSSWTVLPTAKSGSALNTN